MKHLEHPAPISTRRSRVSLRPKVHWFETDANRVDPVTLKGLCRNDWASVTALYFNQYIFASVAMRIGLRKMDCRSQCGTSLSSFWFLFALGVGICHK